jgi:hypothetical protein
MYYIDRDPTPPPPRPFRLSTNIPITPLQRRHLTRLWYNPKSAYDLTYNLRINRCLLIRAKRLSSQSTNSPKAKPQPIMVGGINSYNEKIILSSFQRAAIACITRFAVQLIVYAPLQRSTDRALPSNPPDCHMWLQRRPKDLSWKSPLCFDD